MACPAADCRLYPKPQSTLLAFLFVFVSVLPFRGFWAKRQTQQILDEVVFFGRAEIETFTRIGVVVVHEIGECVPVQLQVEKAFSQ
jgi:hypothetical protein